MPKAADGLSERERRFVDAYLGPAAGNGSEAVRLSGYSKRNADVTADRLLARSRIQLVIAGRRAEMTKAAIASATELQEWWSRVFRGTETFKVDGAEIALPARLLDRLKASELLGKAKGVFVEKHEHTGADGGPVVVKFGGRYKSEAAA